jgi:formamidopyrimidine-DNA glycosylase
MPEGPEIKYIKEVCLNFLLNYELVDVISNSKTVVKLPSKSKLINIESKGKLLILIFKDYYFHIHFGLTGWLVFENPSYPKYELVFKKGNDVLNVYIDDSRRFSKLQFLDEKKHLKEINKLGMDIFDIDFTIDFFEKEVNKVNKKIVSFLLEQNKFCGIGNYIKNESLYIAKINPNHNTSDLDNSDIKNLYDAIKFCAFSNFVDLVKNNKDLKINKDELNRFKKESKLEVPYNYRVYQQEKDPLGHKVIKKDISGRKTFYVKEIQIKN